MFRDRRDAGLRLADRLEPQRTRSPVIVGLPRGGVEVAAAVAERLDAPLDVVVVRKLGCPWQPELGIGAIAEGGVRILNGPLVAELGVRPDQLDAVTDREQDELASRVAHYRRDRPQADLANRVVIVVDDGLATGYTARAAIEAARLAAAREVILAVPVAPAESLAELARVADAVVVVEVPPVFYAIGQFYGDFRQLSDRDVIGLLDAADRRMRTGFVPAAAAGSGPAPVAGPRRMRPTGDGGA